MFENIIKFFKKLNKKEEEKTNKETAKERLHLVLMQDRANVSADFLEMMKQEIIDVIKKYIDVDEGEIDVKLTNKQNSDGTTGAPALYANIPIISIKNDTRVLNEKKENAINKENKTIKSEENIENVKDVSKVQEIETIKTNNSDIEKSSEQGKTSQVKKSSKNKKESSKNKSKDLKIKPQEKTEGKNEEKNS